MGDIKYTFKNLTARTGIKSDFFFQYVFSRKLSSIYHSHDFYEITAVCKGNCYHIINGIKFKQNEDQIVFLRPDDSHCFSKQSPDAVLISLSVQRDEFEKIAGLFSGDILADIKTKQMPEIFYCPSLAANINLNHNVIKNNYEEHDMKFLLSYFIKEYIDAMKNRNSGLPKNLALAIKGMQSYESLKEGVPKFVELSFYSQSHLSRLIKEHFNMTLHEYVLNLRLNAAYNDLILTGESTEFIAEKVGYASLSHFNKIFKEKFKATPAEVRKTRGVWTA